MHGSLCYYAIPSFRRSEIIGTHTLKMLTEQGVPDSHILIFLSDDEDMAAYKSKLKGSYALINTGAKNIVEKFNAIHRYFEPGSGVVFVEDDISELKEKTGENKLGLFKGLQAMAHQSFSRCLAEGTKLWGISSNANPFYMKPGLSHGFKFIVANLFGFISTRDRFLEISQICKSDYERTLLYYVKFGRVLRNDGLCAITKNYKTPGGLQGLTDRAERERISCENIVRRFPHLIEINKKKSEISMYMELKLKTVRGPEQRDLMAMQKILDANERR